MAPHPPTLLAFVWLQQQQLIFIYQPNTLCVYNMVASWSNNFFSFSFYSDDWFCACDHRPLATREKRWASRTTHSVVCCLNVCGSCCSCSLRLIRHAKIVTTAAAEGKRWAPCLLLLLLFRVWEKKEEAALFTRSATVTTSSCHGAGAMVVSLNK